MIANSSNKIYAKTDIPDYLRVGLIQYYEHVTSITLNNTTLIMGYEVKGGWVKEHMFTSETGYLFQPYTHFILISDQIYNTYEEALEQVQILRQQGFKAYVGSSTSSVWRVFIGDPKTKAEAQNILEQVGTASSLNFQIASDNGLRTMMVLSSLETVIFDNAILHSQFMTMDTTYGAPVLDLGERRYREKVEIGRYNDKGLTVVNVIDLEQYLYGVVPAEVGASWPIEALKAQAVAARSYALYDTINNTSNHIYDVCDTTGSQVYKGFDIEKDTTNEAIDLTKHQLIYFGDLLVYSCFFSSSGGHTENSENVWSGTVPYLKGVPDIYETSPEKKPWVKEITATEIRDCLGRYDVYIGDIVDVVPLDYTDAGRVLNLRIVGTQGEHILTKETIRRYLNLYGRKFEVIKQGYQPKRKLTAMNAFDQSNEISINQMYVTSDSGQTNCLHDLEEQLIVISGNNIDNVPLIAGKDNTFIFVGQGWGHGVGMSQCGAKGMAYAGFNYKEILEYYYTGVEVR